RDRSRHALRWKDRAAGEGREDREHVVDRGILAAPGDPRLLRLLRAEALDFGGRGAVVLRGLLDRLRRGGLTDRRADELRDGRRSGLRDGGCGGLDVDRGGGQG